MMNVDVLTQNKGLMMDKSIIMYVFQGCIWFMAALGYQYGIISPDSVVIVGAIMAGTGVIAMTINEIARSFISLFRKQLELNQMLNKLRKDK